jgi:flagellar biogenesis protein FliO
MDILSMMRTFGALGVVLGMLAGALWVVRRYDIKLPGRVSGSGASASSWSSVSRSTPSARSR